MAEQNRTATETRTWALDPAHTQVEFSARHMMFTTVRGMFSDVQGTLVIDEADPDASRVDVEIDAKSIDTRSTDRDTHLRSGDFLDVEKHAKITFRSKRVEGAYAEPGDEFTVVGDLTIRGTTKEVTLEARFEGRGIDPWGGQRAGFSARTKLDRREWGLTWNQALEAGGVLVGHELTIEIQAQAVPAGS
ncbi:MAG TPA: YceI family protein [Longimicrobiales bacterium]|nr:YceI family protein [Longimicrobiales bacterium]